MTRNLNYFTWCFNRFCERNSDFLRQTNLQVQVFVLCLHMMIVYCVLDDTDSGSCFKLHSMLFRIYCVTYCFVHTICTGSEYTVLKVLIHTNSCLRHNTAAVRFPRQTTNTQLVGCVSLQLCLLYHIS